MSDLEAYIALNRFGLGAKGDELTRVAPDPRGWLAAQIDNPLIPDAVKQDMGGKQALAERVAGKKAKKEGLPPPMPKEAGAPIRKVYIAEAVARMNAQIASAQGFVERQVLFWSNHFTVSTQKPIIAALVNRYEADVIRPHINGYFRDMLLASARHPAMLLYLDNARSFGPNSRLGEKREKGLNENYAREVMELHTLGVGGGYTQTDVTTLAKILTGWSLDNNWSYMFRPQAHEPGNKTFLGRVYSEGGEQEGIDALDVLCAHPSTAKHIATKIARHFLSDTPDPTDIDTLAASFTNSKGYLPSVMKTLIGLPNAWKPVLTKIKNPYEFNIAAFRLTGLTLPPRQEIASLNNLNYRPFNATSPAGEGDTVADLAGPDAVMKRIDWAHALSQRVQTTVDPLALAQQHLGGALTETTTRTIKQAASGQDGLAFLLLSPEFQRR